MCSVFESPSPFASFSHSLLTQRCQDIKAKDGPSSLANSSGLSSSASGMTSSASGMTSLASSGLTVVVKRSMVKLNEESSTSHDLVTCQSCDVCVHKCKFSIVPCHMIVT